MTERDESLDQIVEVLREPADLSPELTQRVMAEVSRVPAHQLPPARSIPWWRREWTVRLTPLHGLALAAGLAALLLIPRLGDDPAGPIPESAVETPPTGHLTQFVLVAPEASTVTLVGDFNDWSAAANPLVRAAGDGIWSVTVPLEPGRYRYAFIVDGTLWRPDPESPAAEDEFGRPNSVLTVGGA